MRTHATNVVRELRQRGFQAYFAGGCVRDTLLGFPRITMSRPMPLLPK